MLTMVEGEGQSNGMFKLEDFILISQEEYEKEASTASLNEEHGKFLLLFNLVIIFNSVSL